MKLSLNAVKLLVFSLCVSVFVCFLESFPISKKLLLSIRSCIMLPPKSLASLKRQVGLKLCALRLNISPLGRVGAAQKGGDIIVILTLNPRIWLIFFFPLWLLLLLLGFPGGSLVKNLPAMQETQV